MENTTTTQPTRETSPTAKFLLDLGTALLQVQKRDWMDMVEASDFCKEQGIQLEGKCPGADELETALRGFFQLTGEFYSTGLAVDGYERRVGWDKVFMLRAYPYALNQSPGFIFNGIPDFELPTACND